MSKKRRRVWQRSLEIEITDLPVPVDILVYTLEEWQAMAFQAGRFYRTVEQEARWEGVLDVGQRADSELKNR